MLISKTGCSGAVNQHNCLAFASSNLSQLRSYFLQHSLTSDNKTFPLCYLESLYLIYFFLKVFVMEQMSPKTNFVSSLGFWAGAIDHIGEKILKLPVRVKNLISIPNWCQTLSFTCHNNSTTLFWKFALHSHPSSHLRSQQEFCGAAKKDHISLVKLKFVTNSWLIPNTCFVHIHRISH